MLNVKSTISILALAAVLWLAWCFWPPSVNSTLKVRSIPEIPAFQSCLGVETGGLFAQWCFVAVRADREQIDEYKARLVDDGGQQKAFGSRAGEVRYVEIESYQPPPFDVDGPEVRFKQILHGKYLPWWNVEDVTEGDVFNKSLPNACGYEVILDPAHERIYIYWHYS